MNDQLMTKSLPKPIEYELRLVEAGKLSLGLDWLGITLKLQTHCNHIYQLLFVT